ncbi:hypothetical protein CHS0354_042137 [Potamilus streckersoni]|uniref:NADAR domain-containing protein n=1 Tax=Potamilus streckersoni TaxID=2493646 RepID=A0AAE0TLU5_9BIVA|nr:hypothetical protein CHS0354_042137 [Potamilus streckersoni]
MIPFYCNFNEAMNNQTEEDKHLQQLQQKDDKQNQQQLPKGTPLMMTESMLPQDEAIHKLDENLDNSGDKHKADEAFHKLDENLDESGDKHKARKCSGESDQLSKRDRNFSENQQGHSGHLHNDQTQHQQQSGEQQQDDQHLLQWQSSKPQMEKEPILPKEQVITDEERSGGKGENRGPNPEHNRSGHASGSSGYQGHRGRHERGGKSGTLAYGKNEKPGRVKSGNDRPTSYDATYSDEEDDKTVEHPDFEFFWLKKSPFSQWYPKSFVAGDHQFVTAEQFMMYQKADKILKERNPRKQQKLGRQVKNFNPQKWKEVCLEIVKTANFHKFSQNEGLKNHLFSTYPKILVEASPYDRIWGIGRAASDPKAQTKETWLGHNLLGYALTDVRNKMMMKENIIPDGAKTCSAESALIEINNFDEV